MKNAASSKEIVSVVDLGQSKFIVVVAELVSERNYRVLGYGESVADGVQKGKVVNIDEMVGSLNRAVKTAEVMAGVKVESLCAGISGNYVRGHTHEASTYIAGETVTRRDVEQVMQTAQAHQLIGGDRIIHVLEQSFSINRKNGIRQPLGMECELLEGSAHVISVDANVIANVERCLARAHHPAPRIISNHLASTGAVLTSAEKDLGTILVDFGAGVCDIAVFVSGMLVHVDTVDQGGDEIDNDIARMYRISKDEAERMKREQGSATEAGTPNGSGGGAPKGAAGELPGQLSMIIQARTEEILKKVHERIKSFEPSQISAGIILTGGVAQLANIDVLTKEITGLPVRIGRPTYAGEHADSLSLPQYASALGLVEMCNSDRVAPMAAGKGIGNRLRSAFHQVFTVN